MHNDSKQSGPAEVILNNELLIERLWPFVIPIINSRNRNMKILLQNLGVEEDEASPLLREFCTHSELADAYEGYFSCETAIGVDEENIVVCRDKDDEIELHSHEKGEESAPVNV
jgi:hypothetical protein